MKKPRLYAAIALVVLLNGVVLAGVQFNRTGKQDASVELTEREIGLAYADKENSGVTLNLNWQRFSEGGKEWFNREKLAEVGFDCRVPIDSSDAELHYAKARPRKAFAVMEYQGAAWDAWQARERQKLETMSAEIARGKATLESLEEAKAHLAGEQMSGSRLFPVDVGNDPKKLRERYPNRTRYIIMPVLVRLNFMEHRSEKGSLSEPRRLTGSIDKVLTDTIQVPRNKQGLLSTLQTRGTNYRASGYFEGRQDEKPSPPRYAVKLNYGRRFEPSIVAVRSLAP